LLLRAPRSGEVTEKMVIEGQAVKAGDNLFQIADARVLWVDVAIFEQDAAAVRVGTPATITVDALPGRTFRGRVTFIYPQLDEKSNLAAAIQGFMLQMGMGLNMGGMETGKRDTGSGMRGMPGTDTVRRRP